MNIEHVIRNFASAGDRLPRASMQWALDNWDIVGPAFVELLTRCAEGLDRTEDTKNALFFVIFLMGEKREAAAFAPLCGLLSDAETSEEVLGDVVTEGLREVLICTYNGDLALLKQVIESAEIDDFVRAAALDTMAYLTGTGVLSEDDMRTFLTHLFAEMQPQSESFVWWAVATAVANLGYADYVDRVKRIFDRGFISAAGMEFDDFWEQLQRTLADPEHLAGFEFDRIGPLEDAIGTLSKWSGFMERDKADRMSPAEREAMLASSLLAEIGQPYINHFRDVGRNDPCPCGSGKKYKKCCLQ